MDAVSVSRTEIYNYFHSNASCQAYFFDCKNEKEYVAYYNSMYLLQDSTDGLSRHRQLGFSLDPPIAYIEFWGIMQAAIIQQDSITEIYKVMVEEKLDTNTADLKSWIKVRELRNICAGHPAKKDRPKTLMRTFMGRAFGDYSAIRYEQWDDAEFSTTYPSVPLGTLLDAYAVEAKAQLEKVLVAMMGRWK